MSGGTPFRWRGQLSLQSNEIFWQNEPHRDRAPSCQLRASICCRTRCFSLHVPVAPPRNPRRGGGSRPRSILQRVGIPFPLPSRESRGRGKTPKLHRPDATKTVALRLEAKVREEVVLRPPPFELVLVSQTVITAGPENLARKKQPTFIAARHGAERRRRASMQVEKTECRAYLRVRSVSPILAWWEPTL